MPNLRPATCGSAQSNEAEQDRQRHISFERIRRRSQSATVCEDSKLGYPLSDTSVLFNEGPQMAESRMIAWKRLNNTS
jgi:hypothetical protein